MYNNEKEVYFDKYCSTCIHFGAKDADGNDTEICSNCLNEPSNFDSHKPVNYKELKK